MVADCVGNKARVREEASEREWEGERGRGGREEERERVDRLCGHR